MNLGVVRGYIIKGSVIKTLRFLKMLRELTYLPSETRSDHEDVSPIVVFCVDPAKFMQSIAVDILIARESRNVARYFDERNAPVEAAQYRNEYQTAMQGALGAAIKLDEIWPQGGALVWLDHIDSSMS